MEPILEMLLDEVTRWLPRLAGVVVIVLLFHVAAKIATSAILRGAQRLQLNIHLSQLLTRSGRVVIILFGVVTALGTLGINVAALVAGLGLTGFALGFALKDTISNLLSGILILLYQPFRIGNEIKIAGYEGQVVAIDLRYTELQSGDDKILIPNAKLFTDPITVVRQAQPES